MSDRTESCYTCSAPATRWSKSVEFVTGEHAYCDRCWRQYWLFTPEISREEAEAIRAEWWGNVCVRDVMKA